MSMFHPYTILGVFVIAYHETYRNTPADLEMKCWEISKHEAHYSGCEWGMLKRQNPQFVYVIYICTIYYIGHLKQNIWRVTDTSELP